MKQRFRIIQINHNIEIKSCSRLIEGKMEVFKRMVSKKRFKNRQVDLDFYENIVEIADGSCIELPE